jgi:YidC/Oxa1 family membrane protein insertase
MIFASSIGEIAHPFFIAFAFFLALYYKIYPNYATAIAMLTITVMVVVFPVTRRATRSMMKMQLLSPEMRAIQAKYKAKPGMTVDERRENREHLNEEMMALYRENGVSPTGGCLPMFLQLPAFWILYGTIKGLIHTSKSGLAQPLYINKTSLLYQHIVHAPIRDGHAVLNAFGIDMADSVRSAGLSWPAKIPFICLILAAIALQFVQMRRLQGRNPGGAQANPQMQQMQKYFPLILGVIYISIPAGVNVYFIISSLFRIGQQEFMYKRDPHIIEASAKLRARAGAGKSGGNVVPAKAVRKQAAKAEEPKDGSTSNTPVPKGITLPKAQRNGASRPRTNGAQKNGAQKSNGSTPPEEERPKAQPRARNKRARRPR